MIFYVCFILFYSWSTTCSSLVCQMFQHIVWAWAVVVILVELPEACASLILRWALRFWFPKYPKYRMTHGLAPEEKPGAPLFSSESWIYRGLSSWIILYKIKSCYFLAFLLHHKELCLFLEKKESWKITTNYRLSTFFFAFYSFLASLPNCAKKHLNRWNRSRYNRHFNASGLIFCTLHSK